MEHAGGDLAHAGQAGGADEFLMRGLEGTFHAVRFGDVLAEAKGADDVARLVTERDLAGGYPSHVAIGPGFLLDFADDAFAGADDALLILEGRARVGLVEEIEVGLADDVGRGGNSEGAGERGADGEKTRIEVLEIDAVGDIFQKRRDQRAVEQRVVGRRRAGSAEVHGGNQAATVSSAR